MLFGSFRYYTINIMRELLDNRKQYGNLLLVCMYYVSNLHMCAKTGSLWLFGCVRGGNMCELMSKMSFKQILIIFSGFVRIAD